jgi:hypothetical protein
LLLAKLVQLTASLYQLPLQGQAYRMLLIGTVFFIVGAPFLVVVGAALLLIQETPDVLQFLGQVRRKPVSQITVYSIANKPLREPRLATH